MSIRVLLSTSLLLALAPILSSCAQRPARSSPPADVSYAEVETVLEEYCVRCHSGENPKGELDMTDYASLLKGGKSGAVVIPGDASASLLVELVEEGKMPLGKRNPRPTREEILALRAWIDAGAKRSH